THARESILPLPKGEGWGEGERIAQMSTRAEPEANAADWGSLPGGEGERRVRPGQDVHSTSSERTFPVRVPRASSCLIGREKVELLHHYVRIGRAIVETIHAQQRARGRFGRDLIIGTQTEERTA